MGQGAQIPSHTQATGTSTRGDSYLDVESTTPLLSVPWGPVAVGHERGLRCHQPLGLCALVSRLQTWMGRILPLPNHTKDCSTYRACTVGILSSLTH